MAVGGRRTEGGAGQRLDDWIGRCAKVLRLGCCELERTDLSVRHGRQQWPVPFSGGRSTFEHATACAGWLWGVNSFDQPGVELGKKLAGSMAPAVQQAAWPDGPWHVQSLLAVLGRWRGE